MRRLTDLLFRPRSIAPLVTFRVVMGLLLCVGILRTWQQGWIERLYLEPQFFFKFPYFEWVPHPGETGIYWLFGIAALSALFIALGLLYRLSALSFFLSFSWIQLIDATNYLNHYYLVCLIGLLLIFVPANRAYSLDVFFGWVERRAQISAWCIHIFVFQLTLVYTFAGIAKINYEWLFRAMPLRIWLPEHTDLPLLGYFFQFTWFAYLFSWAGMLYDLTIAYFLLWRNTRPVAYFFVVVFHLMTMLLFNIGLFPAIMIAATLIFFSDRWHLRLWNFVESVGTLFGNSRKVAINDRSDFLFTNSKNLKPANKLTTKFLGVKREVFVNQKDVVREILNEENNSFKSEVLLVIFGCYFAFQLFLPLRHITYNGDLLWKEDSYRFGWRVMLVEKTGNATFYVQDSASPKRQEVVSTTYLTDYQAKQMAIQPDFILQFAHFLHDEFEREHGFVDPVVTADIFVAINGKMSARFVDPTVNLAAQREEWGRRSWVMDPAENRSGSVDRSF